MNPAETLEMSNAIRNRVINQQRISVTELARGTAWRKKLTSCCLLEVVDRGSSVGWLVSNKGMDALLDTIAYFESEAESAQIAYIVESRSGYDEWKSGTELKQDIDAHAEETISKLEAAFYGD